MAMMVASIDPRLDAFIEYPSNGYQNAAPSPTHFPPQFDRYEQEQNASANGTSFPNGEEFVSNPFSEEMDRKFPRLPISPSVLSAYSFMRATNTVDNDPLHSALYVHPSRNCPDERRMQVELLSRRHSINPLAKHTTFFWDPVDEQPRVLIPYVSFDPLKPPPSNISYQEHVHQFPPNFGTNHNKGDLVWQNFGYVRVRGRWVDPDSEGDLADASRTRDTGDEEAPYLPDIKKRPDPGPKVMTPEEQMGFYQSYVEEVSDDIDGEGDPRAYRITPGTFARWAAGCETGERFEEKPFVPGPKLPSPDLKYENEILPFHPPHQQYDVECGSAMSGIYEPDPDPRLVCNAQGVNIVRAPGNFARSYPQAAIDLDTQAFGNGQMYGPAASTASTPEVFTSENCFLHVAPRPGDPHTGSFNYEDTLNKLIALRAEIATGEAQVLNKATAAIALSQRRFDLGREVFFLQEKLASMPRPLFTSSSASDAIAKPKSHEAHLSHYQLDGPSSPPSPKPRLRRPKQYQRYLREELERSEITLNKSRALAKRLDGDHQEVLDEIVDLKTQKESLLAELGVGSTTDLPGLFPVLENSRQDMNAKFGIQ
ncbi:hypothetical protein WAI453_006032 [Rhynchosporium graminicola]|uniref:Uncharacterized protein n=1 Tax=Rhynchosporium graminicola TaxID=2792576 RepID=A0A1E1LAK8_9HELO|nr:uncharacterized protein RCO7_11253 [Rhynchosporium commune]